MCVCVGWGAGIVLSVGGVSLGVVYSVCLDWYSLNMSVSVFVCMCVFVYAN